MSLREPTRERKGDVTMVPLEVAARRVAAIARPIEGTEPVATAACRGRILGSPIVSRHALPRFDNSAMDGYALGPASAISARFRVVGRSSPGQPYEGKLGSGEAIRILTGAAIPSGTVAILRQEHAERCDDSLVALQVPEANSDMRRAGEDVAASETVLSPGTRLDPRHVALLAALGVATVPVKRRLRVAVVSTGNELIRSDDLPRPGSAFDANRPMLLAWLAGPEIETVDSGVVRDEVGLMAGTLSELSREVDLIVTSGGISVGDADHVASAVARAGGSLDRLCVALKPGKRIGYGRIGDAAILALPGNTVAALAAFLLIGRPLVARLLGEGPPGLKMQEAVAGFTYPREPTRTEFLPVRATHGRRGQVQVEPAGPTGTSRLRPLVTADGFCLLRPRLSPLFPGARVDYVAFADLD
ncbi:MAG: molybdopterin molybdotransferase MoeA [Bauldia sp.]|nr:molybdopterin molybdotransferase MoeA [Bauldia sp.]